MKNRNKAIIYILLAALGFALMNTLVRLSGDLPFTQKSFFRNIVAMGAAYIALRKSHAGFHWKKGNLSLLMVRSICGTMGIFCNFYAVDHLLLADASMLNKLSPFFAILFSLVFLREKASTVQWLAVAVAFGGALLIIKPGFSMTLVPALVGASGGMASGAAYTMVRALTKRGENGARIIFFFSAFSTLVTIPFLVFDFHPMSIGQVLILLAAGLAATLGQFGITMAYAHAPAKEISIYDYSQILFATLLGFVLFGQVPDRYSVIGYFIIFLVSVFIFRYNRRHDQEALREN